MNRSSSHFFDVIENAQMEPSILRPSRPAFNDSRNDIDMSLNCLIINNNLFLGMYLLDKEFSTTYTGR